MDLDRFSARLDELFKNRGKHPEDLAEGLPDGRTHEALPRALDELPPEALAEAVVAAERGTRLEFMKAMEKRHLARLKDAIDRDEDLAHDFGRVEDHDYFEVRAQSWSCTEHGGPIDTDTHVFGGELDASYGRRREEHKGGDVGTNIGLEGTVQGGTKDAAEASRTGRERDAHEISFKRCSGSDDCPINLQSWLKAAQIVVGYQPTGSRIDEEKSSELRDRNLDT